MTHQLSGKWALITGASRGIGPQIALGLAELGCSLVLHARQLENLEATLLLLKAHASRAHCVAGDLASTEGVQQLIAGVMSCPGRVDILFNNAAIQNDWKPVWQISQAEWQACFQVNFFSLVALCSAFIPGMQHHGYGRVINLTSGIRDVPNLAPYSASKAAVDKYTQDLAAELRGSNVLVNLLDPGWLRTDLGGPDGEHTVETVLPGALVPALLEDYGPSGRLFAAQDFKYLHAG
jgi:NAD(P)-dependent dehydrogenase (short-subunit alcohol dehydrogenase family)